MKVALLTIWHEMNYGAELQAYATIKAIRQMGHDVKMIDIRLQDISNPNLNGKIGRFVSSFGPGFKKFEKFWKINIPTTQRYVSLEELQRNPPKADVYVVGSDQVWNPDLTKEYAYLYFLDFGNQDIKRISYASSFGVSKWNHPEMTAKISALLSRFQSISCREQEGVSILKETFNFDAENHLDPTLLFPGYPELTGDLNQDNSLVLYPLSRCDALIKYSKDLAKRLKMNFKNANRQNHILGMYLWNRNGMEEWIKTIAQASFVITPSFHGMVLSLIYHRQFAVLITSREKSSRIVNLLSKLNLENRIFYSLDDLEKAKPWNNQIDFSSVEIKLQNLRKQSFEYLNMVLS